jgi:branched-chain amino acid transport system permease protein
MSMKRGSGLIIACLVVAGVAVPEYFFTDYHLFQMTMVVVYAIAVLGLALLTGFNGQISLGHGAFFAIGGYTSAVLMTSWDVPYWATLPVSAAVCGGVGFLVGLPALVAIPQLLKFKAFEGWTGGVQGLVIDKPDAPFGWDISQDQWLFLFTAAVAVVLYVIAWNLVRGRIGRAMMAIRDHAMAAEAMGINIALVKTGTFAVSALFTGLAGSLGAIAVQFVAPDSFGVFVSIFLFVGCRRGRGDWFRRFGGG